MPSTSLQSRINAFEQLSGSTKPLNSRNVPSKRPNSPQNLLETPISPIASSYFPIAPFTPPKSSSRSPSPSPPNLGRKTSLIDLKDWVVDDGPGHPNGQEGRRYKEYDRTPRQVLGNNSDSTPLINLESPPKPRLAPPLPPRKLSYTSLRSISTGNSVASRNGNLQPPARSDSLTIEHTYPPLSKLNTGDSLRKGVGHAPASSISSFHSVSLSSDGGITDAGTPGSAGNFVTPLPMDHENSSIGGDSLDESFENVSVISAMSPITAISTNFDWDKAILKKPPPPPLPQRPASRPHLSTSPSTASSPLPHSLPTSPRLRSSYSSSSSSSSSTARRPPPPPPPLSNQSLSSTRGTASGPPSSRTSLNSTSASDRSSILSTTSRTSTSTRASTQLTKQMTLLRPTPVPSAAKKRYETVFIGNLLQIRKAEKAKVARKPALLSPASRKRQAAGWRGLSVDLITNPENHPAKPAEKEDEEDEQLVANARLDARVVKLIWSASRLDKAKLRRIWQECDAANQGSLDRESFVKGMWRIDEELRRAHLSRQTSASSSVRIRIPPKPSRLILQ